MTDLEFLIALSELSIPIYEKTEVKGLPFMIRGIVSAKKYSWNPSLKAKKECEMMAEKMVSFQIFSVPYYLCRYVSGNDIDFAVKFLEKAYRGEYLREFKMAVGSKHNQDSFIKSKNKENSFWERTRNEIKKIDAKRLKFLFQDKE